MTALIKQSIWDNTYKKGMDAVRTWMKANHNIILDALNQSLLDDVAEKYTEGSISKWEMDSLNFYYHEHELASLKNIAYGIVEYTNLPDEPIIDREFTTKDGHEVVIYEINRIAGTVIDKDKNKGIVTLLTTSGVVTVKVWKSQFSIWDKQISAKDTDGTKHVLEKSWFSRGTKLIITGIKRDDTFIPKKYKNTEWPLFEKIEEIDENGYITKSSTERIEIEE
jgi:DNA polymerase-3 subunit alpha